MFAVYLHVCGEVYTLIWSKSDFTYPPPLLVPLWNILINPKYWQVNKRIWNCINMIEVHSNYYLFHRLSISTLPPALSISLKLAELDYIMGACLIVQILKTCQVPQSCWRTPDLEVNPTVSQWVVKISRQTDMVSIWISLCSGWMALLELITTECNTKWATCVLSHLPLLPRRLNLH